MMKARKVLIKVGVTLTAVAVTLGAAVYSTHRIETRQTAAGVQEGKVIILDAGHGESS